MNRPFKALRRRIEDAGYQETELAQVIGRSPCYFSRRMNGHDDWDAGDIRAICRVINIPANEIGDLFFYDL